VARPGSFDVKSRLRRSRFFNAINSLRRIGARDGARSHARELREQSGGIAGRNSAISAPAFPQSGRNSG
jgi:hypothetical protein